MQVAGRGEVFKCASTHNYISCAHNTLHLTLLLPGLGSGLFFVGYSLSMIPSQYILTQVRVHSVVWVGDGACVCLCVEV